MQYLVCFPNEACRGDEFQKLASDDINYMNKKPASNILARVSAFNPAVSICVEYFNQLLWITTSAFGNVP